MCRINLKDAYFAIPVCREHQPLLRFIWGTEMFQFTCLPFGLISATGVHQSPMTSSRSSAPKRGEVCDLLG